MSENVRIRISKWDLMEEIHAPVEAKRENIHPENTVAPVSNWNSSKFTDIEIPNTSNVDRGNPDTASTGNQHTESSYGQPVSDVRSKDASENSGAYDREWGNPNNSKTGGDNRETGNRHSSSPFDVISVTREQSDQNASKLRNSRWSDVERAKRDRPTGKASGWHRTEDEYNDIKDPTGWGTSLSQSYRASISPGNTEWEQHNRSISPKGRRNYPYRSRSRSRSQSQSRSRSLSRSRSPVPGFRREPDGWSARVRQLSDRPEARCRAFAAGRCQRGTHCRYLHEDGDRRSSYRHHDMRENRYERSRTSVSGRKDYSVEPTERRDYVSGRKDYGVESTERRDSVFDKTSLGQRNSYDDNRRNQSTQQCYDFKMGRCQRGSACKYLHHDASYREHHGRDGYNERTHSREGEASSGNARSHEHRRLTDIPCKFFAVGNCKNGNKCRFSHQNQVPVQSPSFDDKVVQVWEEGNRQSWNGPNWGDQDPEGKSNIPVWTGDKNLTQAFDPGSLDMQVKHTTNSQSSESWKPEWTKYSSPEMSSPTVYPVQVNPQSTLNLHQQFNSTVAPEINAGEVSILMPPDNKEKNMLQVDASTLNDSSLKSNLENCTDDQLAGSLTHGQSFCQTGIAQQPNRFCQTGIAKQSHIQTLSPAAQIQPSVPPIFSPVFTGSSNQHFNYAPTPTIQEQPASSQVSSSTQVIDFNGHAPNFFPTFYSGHNVQNVYALPSGGPAQIATLQPNLNVQGPNGNEIIASMPAHGQSQCANIQPPSGGSAHVATLQPNLNVQCPNVNENLTQLPANGQSQYANVQPHVNLDANEQGLQLPSNQTSQCVTLQLNSVIQAPEQNDKQTPLPQQLCQSWPDKEKQTLLSDTTELNNLNSSSQSLSGNKVVTSEQMAQLSNLSASLAQIFGNSQQLPQLYASLNPVDCSGMAPIAINQPSSMVPVSAVTSVLQSHTNSSGGNGKPELLHVNYNNPDGFLSDIGKKDNVIQDSLVHLQASVPNLTTVGHNNLGDSKSINLVGLKNTTPELKVVGRNEYNEHPEMKANPLGEQKKLEHAEQTEEAMPDDAADGDEKKTKDGKAVRLFKNAVVEFVKDVLKPMWKEGNMSKEAHKTIVKKVVDKVTSVMQSNIPQTQDKVDLYLSHSKAKLTKLVQAYVEKYSKL